MDILRQTYIDSFVATERLKRRADAAAAEWQRWVKRAGLATRLGEHALARAARQRALVAAEREIQLRVDLGRQRRQLVRLRPLAV